MSPRAIKLVFTTAAAFNFLAGALLLAAPQLFLAGISSDPAALLLARQLGAIIGSFGFGYAFVALRPAGNRDLVRLGVIAKSSFVGTVGVAVVAGALPLAAAAPVSADVLFIALFLAALRSL